MFKRKILDENGKVIKKKGLKIGIAFGDGGNDIDMLLAVKNSVVMGHHSPLLDGKGDFVTDTVKNEGIYKALLHYQLLEE